VISSFHRETNENWAILSYYTARSGKDPWRRERYVSSKFR